MSVVAWFGCAIMTGATSYEPLALKLPAPSLKGYPEDLPVGPNIEPYSEKLPAPFPVPKGVTNLSAGKTVTSSREPASGQLRQITDSKKEAFDYDLVTFQPGPQWIQVDLGEPRLIYAIVMWHNHRWAQAVHDVIVQVSDDPSFQRGVETLFNNDRDNSSGVGVGADLEFFERHYGRVVDGKGVKARYVRSYTNGSNLTPTNCWQELEIYGLPTDSKIGDAANAGTAGTETLKLKLPAPSLK